jgi:cyclin-dependent kinase 9
VFEFCEHDLAGLLSNPKVQFKEGETKTIMKQLLNGLFYIHAAKVLHRDMKTSNILINKEGVSASYHVCSFK